MWSDYFLSGKICAVNRMNSCGDETEWDFNIWEMRLHGSASFIAMHKLNEKQVSAPLHFDRTEGSFLGVGYVAFARFWYLPAAC